MIRSKLGHSIQIDKTECRGCVVCTLACPVQAIRVRNGKAEIFKDDLCIDCGECMRVCKTQAITMSTSKLTDIEGYKIKAAVPASALYAQFGDGYSPNEILLALKKIGFDYVYDTAAINEEVLTAIDFFLEQNPALRPMISNYCPPVARIIINNYPDLIDRIIPINVAREIAAQRIREHIRRKHRVSPGDIGVFHITPCASKVVSIIKPVGVQKSELDGAISIRDVYGPLLLALRDIHEDEVLLRSSGVGISWAIGRASTIGLPGWNVLPVKSLKGLIKVLDEVEAGRLSDVDYLDCTICAGGCVGGPLVVENEHIAIGRIEALMDQYGRKMRVKQKNVIQDFEKNFLLNKFEAKPKNPDALDTDLSKALAKMNKIEEYLVKLPGKQCAACGSPTCQALAEDIVAGHAKLSDCVFMRIEELEEELKNTRGKNESD